jgi:hypothetical protein
VGEGVEKRLILSVLVNCKTASLHFLILKGHYHKSYKNRFQLLKNIYIEADWTLSLYPAKNVP